MYTTTIEAYAVDSPDFAKDEWPEITPTEYETNDPNELFKLGHIRAVESRDLRTLDVKEHRLPAGVYDVEIEDPYFTVIDPEIVALMQEHEAFYDQKARSRRLMGSWDRRPGVAYIDGSGNKQDYKRKWGDPVTHSKFFDDLDSPALREWLKLVPTAKALTYLSDPESFDEIENYNGTRKTPLDELAKLWLAAGTDPHAIRTRGTVLAELVNSYVKESGQPESMRWMSVACGTALPSMKGAMRAGLKPELILVDHDETVMKATRELGDKIGFEGNITQHRKNIFDPAEFAELRQFLGSNGGRPRIVDLMGIFEYTGKGTGVDPASFLRSNYDMVHPGGRIIFGQMLNDRPIPDFTMGVVGWPYIEMRSIDEIMEVVEEAGIPTRDVKLYIPTDGVYAVGCIEKRLVTEEFAVNPIVPTTAES